MIKHLRYDGKKNDVAPEKYIPRSLVPLRMEHFFNVFFAQCFSTNLDIKEKLVKPAF